MNESENQRPPAAFRSLKELYDALVALGAKPIHVARISRAWLGRADWLAAGEGDGEKPSGRTAQLPKALLRDLPVIREKLEGVLKLRSRHPGKDSESERLLVTLSDGQTVEEVLLPRRGACVSTQLGCAVGCVFCMTGRSGLLRQLSDVEIVAQAALARALRPETKKIVFMGMGEPSHNLANVLSAVEFLARFGDFGHKDLVISSVGDARLFDALEKMTVRPALALSLHAADDRLRRRLLPRGASMMAAEIVERAEKWARLTGYPIQYEWTLIEGVNDRVEDVDKLIELLSGRYAMVNFIPVNAVPESPWKRPSREACEALVMRLKRAGIVATLRDSAAQDVDGGCGQLRARVLSEASRARMEKHVQRGGGR